MPQTASNALIGVLRTMDNGLHEIKLFDGLRTKVPTGTVVVKAYFDGWWQVMRCFVPRGTVYQPMLDAKRYINELRLLGVAVFLETDVINPAPIRHESAYTSGSEIPIELTDQNEP